MKTNVIPKNYVINRFEDFYESGDCFAIVEGKEKTTSPIFQHTSWIQLFHFNERKVIVYYGDEGYLGWDLIQSKLEELSKLEIRKINQIDVHHD